VAETWAEEVTRLQREIGERQARLHFLVLGDQSKGISGGPTVTDPEQPYCKPDQSCCDFCCGN
jgi:hypothetical protein